tara:strand:- start:228098 stop:228226 length:129 start_codon:yes stop_codon:yes gene_type:complete
LALFLLLEISFSFFISFVFVCFFAIFRNAQHIELAFYVINVL